MTNPADPPARRTPQPRHALLFELIRQRGMAQSVNRRIARAATPDPTDLSHFAAMAARSLTRADAPGARL